MIDFISNFPPELLITVSSYLNNKDICHLKLCCLLLNETIKKNMGSIYREKILKELFIEYEEKDSFEMYNEAIVHFKNLKKINDKDLEIVVKNELKYVLKYIVSKDCSHGCDLGFIFACSIYNQKYKLIDELIGTYKLDVNRTFIFRKYKFNAVELIILCKKERHVKIQLLDYIISKGFNVNLEDIVFSIERECAVVIIYFLNNGYITKYINLLLNSPYVPEDFKTYLRENIWL